MGSYRCRSILREKSEEENEDEKEDEVRDTHEGIRLLGC